MARGGRLTSHDGSSFDHSTHQHPFCLGDWRGFFCWPTSKESEILSPQLFGNECFLVPENVYKHITHYQKGWENKKNNNHQFEFEPPKKQKCKQTNNTF